MGAWPNKAIRLVIGKRQSPNVSPVMMGGVPRNAPRLPTGAVGLSHRVVAPTFLSAGSGNFPVASSLGTRARVKDRAAPEHGAGKLREPANKIVCATLRP
jgi:hypothetical protein